MSKAILITGASTGFGHDTAETPARAGHTVFASFPNIDGRKDMDHDCCSLRAERHLSTGASVVFIVDDDASVRQSLELLVRGAGWQARSFSSAREFLAVPRARAPSCLLLEATLPDLHGLEVQRLVADRADMPVIFITSLEDVPMTVQAMKAGAVEVLRKPIREELLLSATHQALERSRSTIDRGVEIQMLRNRYASLTQREREVMAWVIAGLLNKQIGPELGIAEITVKMHRGSVMRKMDAASLPDLVRMAVTLGLQVPSKKEPSQPVNHALGGTGRISQSTGVLDTNPDPRFTDRDDRDRIAISRAHSTI